MMSKSQIVKTYVFRKHGTTAVKIGRTGNVEKRKRTLETMSGCLLETVAIINSDVEQALHFRFCNLRTIGEWFDDSSKVIQSFVQDETAVLEFSKLNTRKIKPPKSDKRAMTAEKYLDRFWPLPAPPVSVYPLTPAELAVDHARSLMQVAALFDIPLEIAQRQAVKEALEMYGVDLTGFLKLAPAQTQIQSVLNA